MVMIKKSRLQLQIERFTVQEIALNRAFVYISDFPGSVVELGLGSGRTFDHLRINLPDRKIITFDFEIATHPGCEPLADQFIGGDISKSLPIFANDNPATVALLHLDIGTKNLAEDKLLYESLQPAIRKIMMPNGIIVSDRPNVVGTLKDKIQFNDRSYNIFVFN